MANRDDTKIALSEKLEALYTTLRSVGYGGLAVKQDGVAVLAPDRHLTSLLSDATERVGNETYGLCTACEQRISPKRLAALPWARYCTACQEMQEGFAAEVRWNNAA